MFRIEIVKDYWVDKDPNNRNDLCLHGDVIVTINGHEHFEEGITLTGAGLFLMRSLTSNHINGWDPMFPCCAHSMYKKTERTVDVITCPNGYDISIVHNEGHVIISDKEYTITISLEEYIEIIYAFADEVKTRYNKYPSRILPDDKYDLEGFKLFWLEWNDLRNINL